MRVLSSGNCFKEKEVNMKDEEKEVKPHVVGTYHLFSGEISGRSSPVWKGYRPHCHFGENPTSTAIVSMEPEKVYPGDHVDEVGLRFLVPDLVKDSLEKDMVFFLFEGPNKVASFKVENIFWERMEN